MGSDRSSRRRSATDERRRRRQERWEEARDASRQTARATNWTMKRVPVRFAQFIYALMWVAGIAWAASGEVLGGSALVLASASGLIAPVGRELDAKRTSLRAVASIVLLVGAVVAISADVLV